jgi:TatD DNase family protein
MKFVDIGANLMDDRYRKGEYFGKLRHEPDFDAVIQRSWQAGVTHLILTAGTLQESKEALKVVREHRRKHGKHNGQNGIFLASTVGVHPTRCQQEFVDNPLSSDGTTLQTAEKVLEGLREVAEDGVRDGCVVALGEIGLDYDRLQFSPKDAQQKYLRRQFETFLGKDDGVASLPLFLHNRSVGSDLLEELQRQKEMLKKDLKGVVHSFDDTLELAQEFIDLGFYIGLNGCSLRTKENLDVVRGLPLSRILLETDCPYCEIKATHAGFQFVNTTFEKRAEKKFVAGMGVKGRSEPNQIIQVAEVIAGAKKISVEDVAIACYQNTMELYGFGA